MGDQNTILDAGSARHLLRRSGFGAPAEQVQDIIERGLTRGQAADEILDFNPKGFKPGGKYIEDSHNKWVKYMIKSKFPLQEKLVLFWHDHFATGFAKVANQKTMANQNKTLRLNCKGDMRTLVKEINRDPAMIEFLDTVRNHKEIPNENYARELQELFTLGVDDLAGIENYTQTDIVQIARAFTGWSYEYNSGNEVFHDYDHDYNTEFLATRGSKVIFQSAGGFGAGGAAFDANGEGAQEIDTVTDILFDHADSEGQNTVARRTTRRLLEYFAHAIPDPISPADKAAIDEIVANSGFGSGICIGGTTPGAPCSSNSDCPSGGICGSRTFNLSALLRAIFVHDAFYETAAPVPFTPATKKSVKWPVDYVVSTVRLLGMKLKSKYQYVEGGSYGAIRDQLTNMGQTLLDPPSVFGWDWENAWISSSTLLARYNFARDITSAREGGRSSFRPERFIDLSLTDPSLIVDAVTDVLGVTDQVTASEKTELMSYLTDNGSVTPDLNDYDYRNMKLHGLFALMLQSPAYQLH